MHTSSGSFARQLDEAMRESETQQTPGLTISRLTMAVKVGSLAQIVQSILNRLQVHGQCARLPRRKAQQPALHLDQNSAHSAH
jgi:hypothetical protein